MFERVREPDVANLRRTFECGPVHEVLRFAQNFVRLGFSIQQLAEIFGEAGRHAPLVYIGFGSMRDDSPLRSLRTVMSAIRAADIPQAARRSVISAEAMYLTVSRTDFVVMRYSCRTCNG